MPYITNGKTYIVLTKDEGITIKGFIKIGETALSIFRQ